MSFSSVRHAFPHPRSDAVTMMAATNGNRARTTNTARSGHQNELCRLSPVWWRCRFLAFFSLLGEEMIGPLATPKRAAREAGWLLDVAAEEARALRHKKEQAEEERALRATAAKRSGLSSAASSSSQTQAIITTSSKYAATPDPTQLFPNHLPMFDSEEEFAACWRYCLRKIFFYSLLSEEERAGQRNLSRAEFEALPLPPKETLPNEDQLEAIGRRIFWVERIAAYYVAANVTVPRDHSSIDAAVGQLLLEGNSYEEIWERVQNKYGVYVVAHDRDAAERRRIANVVAGTDDGNNGSSTSGEQEADVAAMSPLHRAEYLMAQKQQHQHQKKKTNEEQEENPEKLRRRVVVSDLQDAKRGSASVIVSHASTQTYGTTPATAFFSNLPSQLQHAPRQSSSTAGAGRSGSVAASDAGSAASAEPDEDLLEVERIAQKMMQKIQEEGENGEKNKKEDGGGGAGGDSAAVDEGPSPPPPEYPEEDEEDQEEFFINAVGVPERKRPLPAPASIVKVPTAPAAAAAASPQVSPEKDDLKVAAMLLSSMSQAQQQEQQKFDDNSEAFDGSMLMSQHRLGGGGPSSSAGNGGSVFAPPELKKRLFEATHNGAIGRSSFMARVPGEGQGGGGGGGIDQLRRQSVADETKRRAARLRDDNYQLPTKMTSSMILAGMSNGGGEGAAEGEGSRSGSQQGNHNAGDDSLRGGDEPSMVALAASLASSNNSYSKFNMDSVIDPVSGTIPTRVIRALSTAKGKGEFEKLRELNLAAAAATGGRSVGSAFGDVSQIVASQHGEQQLPGGGEDDPHHHIQQQQQQQQHHRDVAGGAVHDANSSSSSTGVFRCAFHVTGVVKSQLVSHLNLPTAALLTLVGDLEEAVSAAFERLPGAPPRNKKFDLSVPLRALVVRCSECTERRQECVEVTVALCGRQKPQPVGMIRSAAVQTLGAMRGFDAKAGAGTAAAVPKPMRLRAALGMPPTSNIVSFVVHDLEAALLPGSSSTPTTSALTESSPNLLGQQPQQQQQQQQQVGQKNSEESAAGGGGGEWSAQSIMQRLHHNAMSTATGVGDGGGDAGRNNTWVGPSLPPSKNMETRATL